MLIKEMLPNLQDQKEREVGIEIEVETEDEGVDLYAPLSYWNVTEDGSLRGNSAEYVLKVPCKRDRVRQRLKYLSKYLNARDITVAPSDRCGVHIHVNCQNLTFLQTMTFICLYLTFERPLTRYCGDSREGNMFCLRAVDAEYLIEYLSECMNNNQFMPVNHGTLRYSAINIEALFSYGSLEFRALSTPDNVETISTWVEMLLALKDAAAGFNSPQDIVSKISADGLDAFLLSIFKDHADTLSYPRYDEDVFDDLRAVQDIAFSEAWVHREPKKASLKEPTLMQFVQTYNPTTQEFATAIAGRPRR